MTAHFQSFGILDFMIVQFIMRVINATTVSLHALRNPTCMPSSTVALLSSILISSFKTSSSLARFRSKNGIWGSFMFSSIPESPIESARLGPILTKELLRL